VLPGVQPRLGDHGEPLAPLLIEGLELCLGLLGVDGGVDRLEVAGDLLALAPRDVLQRGADEMHDARLHRGSREDRLDRVGKAGQPVDAADQDVADAAGLQIVVGSGQGAVPGLRPVRFPDPPAEPDVPVPEHPALHRPMPFMPSWWWVSMGSESGCLGSGSG
jgi:hypothetical protein